MTSIDDEVLFATMIELADTTTTGFDLVSMSDRLVGACVEVLGVSAAGIMLADQNKSLRVLASSDEETRILELLELQNSDGPCLEAFRTGTPVEGVDLAQFTTRWPHFSPAAMSAGFNTAYALPMRVRDQTIGVLNLFRAGVEPLSPSQVNVARVLADMGAVGIIKQGSLRQQDVLAEELQSALNTRVIIEQAKGVVAERQGISLGKAFEYLRATARSSQRRIADVAAETVTSQDQTGAALRSKHATPTPGSPLTGGAASSRRLPTVATRLHRSTEPVPGLLVPSGHEGRAVDVNEPEMSATPGLVGLRERLVEPSLRIPRQVGTALELVSVVYLVSPKDAFDMLGEASHDLRLSLQDVAIQVVADGRLPEDAILLARRQHPHPNSEEPSQDQHQPELTR